MQGGDRLAEVSHAGDLYRSDRGREGRSIAYTNITKNIVKRLLREGFLENVRKRKSKIFLCFNPAPGVRTSH